MYITDAISRRNHGGRRPATRKDLRKAARAEKKSSTGCGTPSSKRAKFEHRRDVEVAEDYDTPIQPIRKSRPDRQPPQSSDPKPKSILKSTKKKDLLPSPLVASRSVSPPPRRISQSVKDKLAEDDEEIAALEKKLGLKGKKKLPKSLTDDGLDELLGGLDDAQGEDEGVSESRKRKAEGDMWLDRKREDARKRSKRNMLIQEEEDGDEEGSGDGSSGDGPAFPDDVSEDASEVSREDNEVGEEGFDGSNDSGSEDKAQQAPRIRENPYVAPSTSSGPPQKYIPPSLRKPASSDPELLIRLRRQIQGLANRLTEANIISILGDLEKLYRDNARQHVTTTLVDLLLASVCEPTHLPDTLIILPAGFIAAIYKIIGMDFGAQVVQRTVELFDEHYDRASAGQRADHSAGASDSSKETSNLIMLLSELYNFQVIGSNLIYDYFRLFLGNMSELNAELLLKIVRASGPQLRQDDPSSLKDIVAMIRPAVARIGEENMSVRTKFMIETINDLKNNRMKTGGAASAVTSEHTIRMKKTLGTLNTRSIKASEPLRIGLNDIKDSDKKGKWWLVGASWSGNASVRMNDTAVDAAPISGAPQVDDAGTSDLVRLAREQRMNTDVRRAIFITIMSATDCQDAYLKLLKLKLKKVQEYEIPKVIVHCSGAESTYNPYYTLIAKKVCGDRKLKTAFQYCLWDLFKKMGESTDEDDDSRDEDDEGLSTRHIVNLAKMFGTLIVDGGMGLGVLKNLNLSFLQPKTKTFIEVVLVTVLLQSQKQSKDTRDEQAVVNIFGKAKDTPRLFTGLQYFLRKVVSKTDIAGSKEELATVKWACKVARDTLEARASNTYVSNHDRESSRRSSLRKAVRMFNTNCTNTQQPSEMFRSALVPRAAVSLPTIVAPSAIARLSRRTYATEADQNDLVIIGGGVAGYVAAIKAGQEGMKVTCIEKRGTLGGTCLNVGCIPSKALLNNSHLYHQVLHDTKNRGIEVGDVKLNLKQMMKAKEAAVSGLTKGIEFLFKKNNVKYVKGTAAFTDEHSVKVNLTDGGEQTLMGKNFIIATGSEATPFPGLEIDEKRIITSTGAIALEQVPKSMVVIGGGIIGLEMGSVWSRLGAKVTVVEFLGQIGGPGMDAEISKASQKILKKQGIDFKLNTKVIGGDVSGENIKLQLEAAKGGKEETIDADVVLVAIGRRPYTAGLGLENIGLETDDKGRLVIDSEFRTKIPHIRVIGDCTFGPMLAHKAEEEAVAAIEYITKGHGHVNYGAIPSVMYTHPEVAWVGQNEQEVKASGVKYKIGTFPFSANSRAKTNQDSEGLVKIIADEATDRILGVHIIGPNAGEMIAEGTLAIEYGASSEDIGRTSHAHPTLAEAFKEAAMATYGKAIHY
ncbi:hypothetical protein BJ875DRAFT_506667 [Amylocarpus encephaloides]|uniref:Dihydrolipoyl dehydrogenase n=1 Tax=Amylocarpus encephaloides TaxID=45428 RepID=A0A9P7YDF2_9HELO|nr:hypothetical protein BJ875DRAFT_506667 [Amylocarpus encephaloides]